MIWPELRITPVNSGYYTRQIYPRVYVNMFRVKPRATLGLIFFTVLIQNSDKQWKVLSGCLEKVALGNSRGSSDFPEGRTFHCLYQIPPDFDAPVQVVLGPCRLMSPVLAAGLQDGHSPGI